MMNLVSVLPSVDGGQRVPSLENEQEDQCREASKLNYPFKLPIPQYMIRY